MRPLLEFRQIFLSPERIREWWRKPGFWIFVFFLGGLVVINKPPLDDHAWRQTLTLSISENLLETGDLLHPRTDIGRETEGIIAGEFPVFNGLVAGTYALFGVHDWNGRLVSWIFSCIGLWFFYRLMRDRYGDQVALFALVVFMSSITYQFALKAMPDAFALSMVVTGTWAMSRYWQTGRVWLWVLALVTVSAGLLSKVPSVIMLAFLLPALPDRSIPVFRKVSGLIALGIAAGAAAWWMFVWMPHLLETYRNQLIWPVSLSEGWRIFLDMKQETFRRFYYFAFSSPVPLVLALGGLILLLDGRRYMDLAIFFGSSFVFFLFILKTGNVFATHNYYVIPYTPVMAWLAGVLVAAIPRPVAVRTGWLVVLMIPGFFVNFRAPLRQMEGTHYLRLGEVVDRYVKPEEKIMVNKGNFNPTMMYFAGRQGWTVNEDEARQTTWMPDFRKQGLRYIVIDRHISPEPFPYELVHEDEDFRIYRP